MKINIDIGNINILLQYIDQQYIDLYPCPGRPVAFHDQREWSKFSRPMNSWRGSGHIFLPNLHNLRIYKFYFLILDLT